MRGSCWRRRVVLAFGRLRAQGRGAGPEAGRPQPDGNSVNWSSLCPNYWTTRCSTAEAGAKGGGSEIGGIQVEWTAPVKADARRNRAALVESASLARR